MIVVTLACKMQRFALLSSPVILMTGCVCSGGDEKHTKCPAGNGTCSGEKSLNYHVAHSNTPAESHQVSNGKWSGCETEWLAVMLIRRAGTTAPSAGVCTTARRAESAHTAASMRLRVTSTLPSA